MSKKIKQLRCDKWLRRDKLTQPYCKCHKFIICRSHAMVGRLKRNSQSLLYRTWYMEGLNKQDWESLSKPIPGNISF